MDTTTDKDAESDQDTSECPWKELRDRKNPLKALKSANVEKYLESNTAIITNLAPSKEHYASNTLLSWLKTRCEVRNVVWDGSGRASVLCRNKQDITILVEYCRNILFYGRYLRVHRFTQSVQSRICVDKHVFHNPRISCETCAEAVTSGTIEQRSIYIEGPEQAVEHVERRLINEINQSISQVRHNRISSCGGSQRFRRSCAVGIPNGFRRIEDGPNL